MLFFFLLFFSFEYNKRIEKNTLNSIVLQNLCYIYLIMLIYLINYVHFDFIFKFFLQRKKIYTLKFIVVLKVSLLLLIFGFKDFFPFFFKAHLHSRNMSSTTDAIRWQTVFNSIWGKRNVLFTYQICSVY